MTLLVLFIVLTYIIFKFFKDSNLSTSDFIIGWGVKIIYALLFYWVTVYYYGHGKLYGDVGMFMSNSKYINEIAYEYPWEYIKLLFGFADFYNPDLQPYLEPTNIFLGGVNEYDYFNDNRLIIKLNSIIHFISNGNFFIHLLIHTFISYCGILLIFKTLKQYITNKKWFWWGLILLPSISFWSSGVTKGSLLILFLGLFFYGIKLISQKRMVSGGVLFILGLTGFLLNKPFVTVVILPLTLFFIIGVLVKWKTNFILPGALLTVLFFGIVIFDTNTLKFTERISFRQNDMINTGKGGIYFTNDSSFCYSDYKYINRFERVEDTLIKVNKDVPCNYKLFGTKDYHQFNLKSSSKLYTHYLTFAPSNSYYKVPLIHNSPYQLIKNIPLALIDVIIRPYPWDNGSHLKYFSFVQNMGLLLFLVYSFFNRHQNLSNQQKWIIFYLTACVVFISLIIGLTTPIFGAIVRYKMPIDLFLLIISFILLKPLKHETH